MRPSRRPASFALQCLVALLVVALVRPPAAEASSVPELVAELTFGAAGPRIAVVVVSQDLRASQQQGALEGAAEAALERAARFTVLPAHDAFNPGAARKREDKLEDARQKMKLGKQALDDLDNVKATEAFTQALDALQSTDLSRNFPALLEAWTMKAAGHATGGENGPAKKDIEAVVALALRSEFTPTFFPPDLIKFAEAQRKFAANAKGELLVRTEPPGARVWVDGLYRGISPVTVAGLTGAKHFVAASEGGYALGQSQAGPGEEVLSLASAELGPGWKKATTEIKKDPEGSTRDSAAQRLGKAAQLDQLLLVVSKKSVVGEQLELIGLRLEVRDGHNAAFRSATVNPGDPEALAAFFDGLTGKDAKRDGRDAVHHFKGGGGSPLKQTLGITLLGVGGVALIGGVVFGIMASGKVNEFRDTAQTRAFESNRIVADGKLFAGVADVSYLIGLAAAGTGGVLLLTNGSGATAEEPAPAAKSGKSSDEAKRREVDGKAAEDRRAAEARTKEDERRREEDRKRDSDSKAAEDKRRAEQEEARLKGEDARKKEEAEKSPRKLSRKDREALERKEHEEEKRLEQERQAAAADDQKRAEDEERARKAEDKKAEDKKPGKLTKKQKDEEERKAKADEESRATAEAEAKKMKEDEERKKREEAEKKKKSEDHDDLRNY